MKQDIFESGASSKLVLGGHSFIQQLGIHPQPSCEHRKQIVSACLDRGINWFDTTYQPERSALGQVLNDLGRRREANIIAWNFFKDFDVNGDVGLHECFNEAHIFEMLHQLQTDYIDCIVIHNVGDPSKDRQQELLVRKWQSKGLVKLIGAWSPSLDRLLDPGVDWEPYDFMVLPHNLTTENTHEIFAAAKSRGLQNFACSPFYRGWGLQAIVDTVVYRDQLKTELAESKVADIMLRYSLFAANVDKLIISMRQEKLVYENLQSVQRGPLNNAELQWIQSAYKETKNRKGNLQR